MSDNQTTVPGLVREAFCEGYQRAVDVMRRWADDFGDYHAKRAVRECADMVEEAKPDSETSA